jgi:transcriptional repressor NrdR
MRACEKRPVRRDQIDQVVEDVEARLRSEKTREVSSSMIGEFTLEQLKDLDQVAYIRFASVYRSFADIETFQREIQELQG